MFNREDLCVRCSDDYYKENLPIECDCGCKETEDYDEYYEEYGRCEYKTKCANCGRYLGIYSYGYWDY